MTDAVKVALIWGGVIVVSILVLAYALILVIGGKPSDYLLFLVALPGAFAALLSAVVLKLQTGTAKDVATVKAQTNHALTTVQAQLTDLIGQVTPNATAPTILADPDPDLTARDEQRGP